MDETFLEMAFPCGKAAMYISLSSAGDMGGNTQPQMKNRMAFYRATGLDDEADYPLMLEQIHSHIIRDAGEFSELYTERPPNLLGRYH